jgi:hypothetical protein
LMAIPFAIGGFSELPFRSSYPSVCESRLGCTY